MNLGGQLFKHDPLSVKLEDALLQLLVVYINQLLLFLEQSLLSPHLVLPIQNALLSGFDVNLLSLDFPNVTFAYVLLK